MGKVDCIVEMRKEEYARGYVDGYNDSIIIDIVMKNLLFEGYSYSDIFRYREILKNKFKNREI